MLKFVHRVQAAALALGAPGLFIVAFLDSSILSLPEIADLLVVLMVTRHPSRMLVYVASAVAGSLLGCLSLYCLGRVGGDAFLRKRFSTEAIDRTLARFQRHGIMTVLIPAILPPPAPFKIFVLLAGLADITIGQFTIAILIGRGVRYLVLGILAVQYGERTLAFLARNGTTASLVVVAVVAVGFVAYLAWIKYRKKPSRSRTIES